MRLSKFVGGFFHFNLSIICLINILAINVASAWIQGDTSSDQSILDQMQMSYQEEFERLNFLPLSEWLNVPMYLSFKNVSDSYALKSFDRKINHVVVSQNYSLTEPRLMASFIHEIGHHVFAAKFEKLRKSATTQFQAFVVAEGKNWDKALQVSVLEDQRRDAEARGDRALSERVYASLEKLSLGPDEEVVKSYHEFFSDAFAAYLTGRCEVMSEAFSQASRGFCGEKEVFSRGVRGTISHSHDSYTRFNEDIREFCYQRFNKIPMLSARVDRFAEMMLRMVRDEFAFSEKEGRFYTRSEASDALEKSCDEATKVVNFVAIK